MNSSTRAHQVWLVTGAGRGLGQVIAEELLGRGHSVVVTARDADSARARYACADQDRLLVTALDVTERGGAERVVAETLGRFGRLDGLVNNAGYGLLGAVEEASEDELEAVFRTNVFGVHRMLRAALPALRDSGAGRVVNISSLGGFAASAGWGVYNATKFAVEGLSEALAIEGAPFGLRVLIVEPGAFRTEFLSGNSMRTAAVELDAYASTAGRTRVVAGERHGNQTGDPVRAAKAIVDAVESANPPLRLVLGTDAVRRVEAKLGQVRRDLDSWAAVSTSTDITA
jgi:NAD(P)-dependent dehydrogenase (short-subunit alcohol dehydrogenase family)